MVGGHDSRLEVTTVLPKILLFNKLFLKMLVLNCLISLRIT